MQNDCTVVGDQCVYTRNETIIEKTFNATAELCCSMSGVHYRYQQGLEAKCCGGKYRYKEFIYF